MNPLSTAMTDPSYKLIDASPPAGHPLVQRVRHICGLTISILIFWYVGWWVAGPSDPMGPVTLLLVDHGVIAMAEILGIAIAAGGLAVAVSGPRSGHAGPLAIATGLAALGARGGKMDTLMMLRLSSSDAGLHTYPATEMIAETCLWLAVIAVGFIIGRWVESWFGPEPPSGPARRAPVDSAGEIRQGIGSTVVCALVAYNVIRVAGGLPEDAILTGQIYFAVGLGFLLSTMLAQWIFRPSSRLWGLIAVAVVAIVAYTMNGPDPSAMPEAGEPAVYVILTAAARPLPIEYAALGAIGSLIGFGLGNRLHTDSDALPD